MKRFIILFALCLAACGSTPQVEQPTQPPLPTNTAVPTMPPKPTDTPAPTSTPRPTNTPLPPTPTPAPIALKGQGKTVTDSIHPPGGINRVRFIHNGKRNFIVTAYTDNGNDEILVNKIGPYSGQSLLIGREPVYFEVNADGAWSIEIEEIYQTDAATKGFAGRGDTVSDGFDPARIGPIPYHATHDGERNFIAHLLCSGGEDYAVNEIGHVQGDVVVRFAKGPCVWQIQADGNWSLMPK